MNRYSSLCDDFYINMNLGTEMELSCTRETVLHFFEQMQKHYPQMRNFYSREKGDFVLEEDKDHGRHASWPYPDGLPIVFSRGGILIVINDPTLNFRADP